MFIRHILKTTASSESVNSAVEIGMSIRTTAYGSGGGGSPGNNAPGGNGYQGIVIIAYIYP